MVVFASISKPVFLCIIPDLSSILFFFATQQKKNACKSTYKRFCVPRPAFEIIKVGKMWVKRKMRKNATITLYFNML